MNAAKELKKYSKVADVVVPMEAKPGIYIMEKAPGISVKTLVDYYNCERMVKFYKNEIGHHTAPNLSQSKLYDAFHFISCNPTEYIFKEI